MATIRKRGDRWHVQVRRKGSPSVTRSFLKKSDAQTWARHTESIVDKHGLPPDRAVLDQVTIAELFIRYRDEVIPNKRGQRNGTLTINAFLRHALAQVRISDLTVAQVASYRDERLRAVKATTLNRQLDVFRHVLKVARNDWGLPLLENPFAQVTRPRMDSSRSRRIQSGEWDRLETACRQCRNPYCCHLWNWLLRLL
jgi:hypothetical protein